MLKTGDILLFKGESKSFCDLCIAKLTHSDVCHAAMVYSEDSMVQMCTDKIGVYYMREKPGDEVYVMRLKSGADPKPLILAANSYLDAEIPYNFPAIVILAGLLVYRELTHRQDLLGISDRIVKMACNVLDGWLHRHHSSDVPKMICSQLVYQIYYNSGVDYRIILKNNLFSFEDNPAQWKKEISADNFLEDSNHQQASPEELAEELLNKLNSPIDKPVIKEPDIPYLNTPIRNQLFQRKLVAVFEKAEVKMAPESLFVMPGDILQNSLNLELVGKCVIEPMDPVDLKHF